MAILMTTRMTAHLALTLTKSSLWHRRRILLLYSVFHIGDATNKWQCELRPPRQHAVYRSRRA